MEKLSGAKNSIRQRPMKTLYAAMIAATFASCSGKESATTKAGDIVLSKTQKIKKNEMPSKYKALFEDLNKQVTHEVYENKIPSYTSMKDSSLVGLYTADNITESFRWDDEKKGFIIGENPNSILIPIEDGHFMVNEFPFALSKQTAIKRALFCNHYRANICPHLTGKNPISYTGNYLGAEITGRGKNNETITILDNPNNIGPEIEEKKKEIVQELNRIANKFQSSPIKPAKK